jgi:pyruvate/2-oxoacid:ferredoxin oxidoreductase alpha subunit
VAVLDRTKEPGALAEPLHLDVMTALAEAFSSGERETLPRQDQHDYAHEHLRVGFLVSHCLPG